AIYPASLDMHSYNFLMQEVPFETRRINLVVVMRPVNLWKLQQTFLPRALGELSPRWLFVKTAENSTHLARHTSRSPFYPDPSTSSPHLFQFFSTGYLHRGPVAPSPV